jgi:hypothetical protein
LKNINIFLLAFSVLFIFHNTLIAQERVSEPKSDNEEENYDVACGGVERWAVKVFTDPLAGNINWTPKPTSIAHLVAISTPTPSASMPRYQPVEDSTYVVNCRITIKKDEADDDFHLVLSDGINTLIGEVPDPTCSSVSSSPKAAQFIAARNWVMQYIGSGNVNNVNLPPVTVTGVAFIDPPHGQTGEAPNHLELHSIFDIHFTPVGSAPSATTQAATSVATTSATLNGIVNPNSAATVYHFDWGLTASYGNATTSTSAGSGSAGINVSSSIPGLALGTMYHFRLVAVNSLGTTNGNDLTLTTISPSLSVAPSNQPVTATSGTTSFTATSNTNWTTSSDQSWCTPTISGAGNGTVTANYQQNSTNQSRVANITVTALGLTPVTVTVTQGGLPVLPEPTNHPDNFSGCNIHLVWADATGAFVPTGYLIRMSNIGFDIIETPVDGTPVPDGPSDKNVAAGIQEAWFVNLTSNTAYYFKIFGYQAGGGMIDYKTDGQIPSVQKTTPICH